jgi:hypothetical protein
MPDSSLEDALSFSYTFQFPNGTKQDFEVRLDAETLELLSPLDVPKPAWTKLKYFQCENCPLSDDVEYCPVAVNLATLVETFKDSISFENTTVRVQTAERTYEKQTSLQKGLSSIIGIYMVTSNCPVMDALRPNVRFHLPFASMDETIYRAVAMYLVAQYMRMLKGKEPDWELKHLVETYQAIAKVNKGMSDRIRAATAEDANVNAVIILSTQGGMVPTYIEDSLADMEHLFRSYINQR